MCITVQCIFCAGETKVVDTRDSDTSTRRRRECMVCGKRFTTYEHPEISIAVLKKDGRHEPYNREKLAKGIEKAFEKLPYSKDQITALVDKVEREIRDAGDEITSNAIGEIVMRNLKDVDKVAYIRFASVYRSFNDLDSFEKELKLLKRR